MRFGGVNTPVPFRTLALAAVALAAATPVAAPTVARVLVLDRSAVLSGEVWRVFTGHLVHAGREHLLWDVLALIGIGFIFEEYLRGRFWQVLGVSALVVGAGLMILEPGLPDYRGLSGVLNGLWVAGGLLGARIEMSAGNRTVARLCIAAVVLDLAKILVEARFGSLFTDAARLGAPTVLLSHSLGFASGAIAYGFWRATPAMPLESSQDRSLAQHHAEDAPAVRAQAIRTATLAT